MEKRKPYWERMGKLTGSAQRDGVRGLSAEELKELALLYRQVAGDLSALRQDGGARTYEAHLNTLLARAHTFVYAGRSGGWREIFAFLARDYPRLFRRLLPYSLASLALFLAGGLLGALLTQARPVFMEQLLGPRMVETIRHRQMWTESITSMAPAASSGIMTNNLGVTFATFALGITAGLGTMYMIGWNGVLIGVIGTACAHAGMSVKLWSFVVPHGSLELPSIILAGAAGLRLARGVVAPGLHSRRYALALAAQESVRLLAGTIPLLVVAGLLEGFFSPSASPVWMKFSLGAVLFALLAVWLSSGLEGPAREATAAPSL
jgi:uncharacterized membrane protein SpoIIM required for sporulation